MGERVNLSEDIRLRMRCYSDQPLCLHHAAFFRDALRVNSSESHVKYSNCPLCNEYRRKYAMPSPDRRLPPITFNKKYVFKPLRSPPVIQGQVSNDHMLRQRPSLTPPNTPPRAILSNQVNNNNMCESTDICSWSPSNGIVINTQAKLSGLIPEQTDIPYVETNPFKKDLIIEPPPGDQWLNRSLNQVSKTLLANELYTKPRTKPPKLNDSFQSDSTSVGDEYYYDALDLLGMSDDNSKNEIPGVAHHGLRDSGRSDSSSSSCARASDLRNSSSASEDHYDSASDKCPSYLSSFDHDSTHVTSAPVIDDLGVPSPFLQSKKFDIEENASKLLYPCQNLSGHVALTDASSTTKQFKEIDFGTGDTAFPINDKFLLFADEDDKPDEFSMATDSFSSPRLRKQTNSSPEITSVSSRELNDQLDDPVCRADTLYDNDVSEVVSRDLTTATDGRSESPQCCQPSPIDVPIDILPPNPLSPTHEQLTPDVTMMHPKHAVDYQQSSHVQEHSNYSKMSVDKTSDCRVETFEPKSTRVELDLQRVVNNGKSDISSQIHSPIYSKYEKRVDYLELIDETKPEQHISSPRLIASGNPQREERRNHTKSSECPDLAKQHKTGESPSSLSTDRGGEGNESVECTDSKGPHPHMIKTCISWDFEDENSNNLELKRPSFSSNILPTNSLRQHNPLPLGERSSPPSSLCLDELSVGDSLSDTEVDPPVINRRTSIVDMMGDLLQKKMTRIRSKSSSTSTEEDFDKSEEEGTKKRKPKFVPPKSDKNKLGRLFKKDSSPLTTPEGIRSYSVTGNESRSLDWTSSASSTDEDRDQYTLPFRRAPKLSSRPDIRPRIEPMNIPQATSSTSESIPTSHGEVSFLREENYHPIETQKLTSSPLTQRQKSGSMPSLEILKKAPGAKLFKKLFRGDKSDPIGEHKDKVKLSKTEQLLNKVPFLGHSKSEKRNSNVTRGDFSSTKNTRKSKSQDLSDLSLSDDSFVSECLRLHNLCRENHGAPPLTLNHELCTLGKEWANILVNRDVLEHRSDTPHGENIYCLVTNAPSYNITPKEVVGYWYSENEKFTYNKEPSKGVLKSGQFTQMVWKDTKEFGIGRARGAKGRIIAVAYYSPPGNYIGKFGEQVGKPRTNLQILDKPEKTKKSIFGNRRSRSRSQSLGSSSDEELDPEDEKFSKDGLKAHNDYRVKHGVKKLKLSKKLTRYSKEWAKHLAYTESMTHRTENNYGENLYMSWSSSPNHQIIAKDAVKSWYNEISLCTFGDPTPDSSCYHFTQVVWKDSTKLGMAFCKSRTGKIYVVANYSPAGNFIGRFHENVFPLQ